MIAILALILMCCTSLATRAGGPQGCCQSPVVTAPLPPVYSVDMPAGGNHAPGPLPTSPVPGSNLSSVVEGRVDEYQTTQPSAEILLIDLGSAWRLAARQNPTIALAQQVVQENLAYLLQARTIALPDFNAGASYHLHNGNLQRSSGQILDVPNERALYVGGGSRAIAAETVGIPAVQFVAPLADVIYAPLATRQDVNARTFDARATSNSILLDVTTQYLELVGAEASFAALRRSEFDMGAVLRVTVEFARVGEGLNADANRMRSAALLLRSQVEAAEGNIAVASAQLARLLQLNPSVALRTPAGPLAIVSVVDANETLQSLVATALRYRPEIGARASDVAAADVRFRQERIRPLLPTFVVGFSAGMFGGGSSLVIPTNGSYSGRSDFDVLALWTLQNLGVGNAGLRNQRRAQMNQAQADRTIVVNQIRDEVASARAATLSRLQEVYIAQRRLALAEAGFQREVRRARANEGLPIEALNMVDLLVEARQVLVRAVIDYDQAEFRLFVALGGPPPAAIPVVQPQAIPGTSVTPRARQ
jgi:outer membrane protein TolC